MASLMSALLNSGNALQAYNQALNVTENNTLNASTPGYAAQTATFIAMPFDPSVGLPGGVMAGPVQSSRSAFAEQAVQQQSSALGASQQQATDLNNIQQLFSLTSTNGVPASMDTLFQSFSALSINPNDPVARQTVLNDAQQVAQSFNAMGNGLATASANETQEAASTITSINSLASQIAQLNGQRQQANGTPNAGTDANLYADLEQLSKYAGFSALQQPDGSISVFLGGQTPIVMGNQSLPIQGDFSLPQMRVLNAQGNDITSQISSGQLSAEINVQNNLIPSYMSSVNTLAQSLADQVNTTLSQGVDQNGNAPVNNLFTYNASTGAAQTLAVNPLMTTDQIAAALPGAPGGNGNALNVAALTSTPTIGGYTFDQYFGALGGQAGSDIANANANQTSDQQLLTQAQSLRSQISGVSLDAEATNLIQFQRSYQAVAKMVTVLDDLTNTLLNMIPGA